MQLAHRINRLGESATMQVAARIAQLRREGRDIINLAVGESDFNTPDFIKEAAARAMAENKTRYTITRGIPELRDAVCRRLHEDQQLEYDPDAILVSNGAKQAIYNVIMALVDDGDEVIVPAPYWPSHPEMIRLAGALPVFVKCASQQQFKITAEQLRTAVTARTRAILLSNPGNPSGMVYSRAELKSLVEAVQGCDIVFLCDEIYAPLLYDDVDFASIGHFNSAVPIVFFQGVSKAYAMTGWRIGYACGPKHLIAAAEKIQSHNASGPVTISQYAALEALTAPQDFVKEMLLAFTERRLFVAKRLSQLSGFKCEKPYGAFYFFPDIRGLFGNKIKNAPDFCMQLLEETGVAAVPGDGFGLEGHVRLSYAASMEDLDKALSKIEVFVHGKK